MRFIETKTHGVLDYLMGILLIAAPWVFDFARDGAETWIPVILGAAMILLAIMTDYEVGLVRRIGMPTHLTIDVISGAFLAASPWLFGFADYIYAPHLIFGLLEIGAALMTKRQPSTESNRVHHGHRPGHYHGTANS